MNYSHPGAGDLTTVEYHRPLKGKRGVGEKKRGLVYKVYIIQKGTNEGEGT